MMHVKHTFCKMQLYMLMHHAKTYRRHWLERHLRVYFIRLWIGLIDIEQKTTITIHILEKKKENLSHARWKPLYMKSDIVKAA